MIPVDAARGCRYGGAVAGTLGGWSAATGRGLSARDSGRKASEGGLRPVHLLSPLAYPGKTRRGPSPGVAGRGGVSVAAYLPGPTLRCLPARRYLPLICASVLHPAIERRSVLVIGYGSGGRTGNHDYTYA